jgi:hypothetical protein
MRIRASSYSSNESETVLSHLETILSSMPEQQRIILSERHGTHRVTLDVLAQRFGFSREKVRQKQLQAQSRFWRWGNDPVDPLIREAKKQLSHYADGYVPNSGGIPALDGDLEKIRSYSGLLNWAGKNALIMRPRLFFDIERNRWIIFF